MGKKLYVGNLSFNVTEEDLRELFAKYGEVTSVSLLKDKFSGRSRGFAFVELANNEEADKAISELNGQDLQGRALRIDEARQSEGGGGGGHRGGGGFGGGRGGEGRRGGGGGGGRGRGGFRDR